MGSTLYLRTGWAAIEPLRTIGAPLNWPSSSGRRVRDAPDLLGRVVAAEGAAK